jgi:hypothetical protein
MRTASSIESASTRLKPASISFVSVKGPSSTVVRPSRTRTERALAGGSSCSKLTRLPTALAASACARHCFISASKAAGGIASSKVWSM